MRDLLADVLDRLHGLEGVRSALLVDARAGVLIAGRGTDELDARATAALTAILVERLGRALTTAEFGMARAVVLLGTNAHLVVSACAEILIILVASPDARLESLRAEVKSVVEELR